MIQVYVDGACSNNGTSKAIGGYAFIILQNNEIVQQYAQKESPSTNNRCELLAMIEGCDAAASLYPNQKVSIFSDSAYCINCYLQKWFIKWEQNGWKTSQKKPVENQDLWERLIPFFLNSNFDFIKVAGHSGNHYNEKVDQLAKNARK